MKLILDDRERQILKSDTARLFALLTIALPAAAAWFATHREQLPTWAVLAGGGVLSAIGLILRFRPQAQILADVLTGDKTLEQGVSDLIDSVPGVQTVAATTDTQAVAVTTTETK